MALVNSTEVQKPAGNFDLGSPMWSLAWPDKMEDVIVAIPAYHEISEEVDEIKAYHNFQEDNDSVVGQEFRARGGASQDRSEDWIHRNPNMNSLTGEQTWNAEAPVAILKEQGFLTANTLHYVRNHSKVPKLSFFEHTITVSGLVEKPLAISMQELVQMPTITMPVTLNCAGNRRKEQNMIKRGIGFHWGCSAASTAIWTGVPLHVFLDAVGIKDSANWINFEGPRGETLLGKDETYGASHTREICMNPSRCAMLAFLMNGEPLHPDHGYPVRLLIPGFIGGRMIKWLANITVTEKEGLNYYHLYDNRVFPKHLDSMVDIPEEVFQDPNYRIDDRNLNSAIQSPTHCAKVPISQEYFMLGGYAYNGGGMPVHRVEITLNGGINWRIAHIKERERPHPSAMGMHYCWVLWELEVLVEDLAQADEIAVRAWNGQNSQPAQPDWNLMGMMNNNWYRVKVKHADSEAALWFEHPTRVEKDLETAWRKEDLYVLPSGKLPSRGWMEEKKKEVEDLFEPKEEEILDQEKVRDIHARVSRL
jgi:nitrate reductase (NAD(P)H)